MITPRRTRLVRVPDLTAFHHAIAACAFAPGTVDSFAAAAAVRQTAVLVSTAAAAAELRSTLENLLLGRDDSRSAGIVLWPDLLTRDGWYERLHQASAAPRLLGAIEREVMLARAARTAIAEGHAPPFRVRPALVAEMLVLVDTLLRQNRTLEAFERLLVSELEPQAAIDRGAERLLRQTRFLVSAFGEYRRLVRESGCVDEHLLREHLLTVESCEPPYKRLVVTVGDRLCGPGGLWPVDFDLLTRVPGVEHIDLIVTENVLSAGFHERLQDRLPGFEETEIAPADDATAERRPPRLVAPRGEEKPWWVSRDREEEIASVARRVKRSRIGAAAAPALDRVAVVCKRPLPYVYLAQSHLGGAGVPFQAFDELPLAAEPFAAALDLVFRFVESRGARGPAVALLRSPHFAFADVADGASSGGQAEDDRPARLSIREATLALDRRWRELGSGDAVARLQRIIEEGRAPGAERRARLAARAADVVAALWQDLVPLLQSRPTSAHCDTLLAFVEAHATIDPLLPTAARTARARGAIVGALRELRFAHLAHDDPPADLREVVARVRRWIEGQTFSPRTGSSGVHVVDAEAARYGDFDDVYLVGLIEREWPDKTPGTIFYPASLLTQLGWPADRSRLAAARAAFKDLVRLPARTLSVSTFVLEDDAIVEASPFLDDLERSGLETDAEDPVHHVRVLPDEALALDHVCLDALPEGAREWAGNRQGRSAPSAPQFHGSVGASTIGPQAVRRIEAYLDCPFKYFIEAVLRLKDESDDDPTEGPLADGRFLHEVLAAFYERWHASGGRAITVDDLDKARQAFADVVERSLEKLPQASRVVWRSRLLGSPGRSGIGEVVLRMEAATGEAVVERLLEHRFDGPSTIAGRDTSRTLTLRGVADRIDVLDGGRLRIIDYKLGRAPNVQRAIQLPVYAVQAQQQLSETGRERLTLADAAYIAFGGREPYVGIATRGRSIDQAVAEGQQRVLDAVDGIEAGRFPPQPAEGFQCTYCAYARVCRKDYVDGD